MLYQKTTMFKICIVILVSVNISFYHSYGYDSIKLNVVAQSKTYDYWTNIPIRIENEFTKGKNVALYPKDTITPVVKLAEVMVGNKITSGASTLSGGITRPKGNKGITWIDTNNPAEKSGIISRWIIYAGNEGNVKLKFFRLENDRYLLIGESTIEKCVLGINSFDLRKYIRIEKGDYIGVYFEKSGTIVNNPGIGKSCYCKLGDVTQSDFTSTWTKENVGILSIQACGFPSQGFFTSDIIDFGPHVKEFKEIRCISERPVGTALEIWFQNGDSSNFLKERWSRWIRVNNGSLKHIPAKRYGRFKIILRSNGKHTPTVKSVFIDYLINFYNLETIKKDGNRRKILLICQDAGAWKILNPLLEKGKLPNIKKLMINGASGKLKPLYYLSAIDWTTIATGNKVEKHGIDEFCYSVGNVWFRYTSTMRKTKAVWNILSDYDISVGVINWLITYPAEKVNGYMISNSWFEPDYGGNPNFKTFPAQVEEVLKESNIFNEKFDLFESKLTELKSKIDAFAGSILEIKEELQTLYEYEKEELKKFKEIAFLLNRFPAEFTAIGFYASDAYQHKFWDAFQPELFDITEEEIKYKGEIITDYYQKIDEFIGKILNKKYFDNIILVSDHGGHAYNFGPVVSRYFAIFPWAQHYIFGINSILKQFNIENAYFFNDIQRKKQGICVNSDSNDLKSLCLKILELLENIQLSTGEKVFVQTQFDDSSFSCPQISFQLNPEFIKKVENILFTESRYNIDKQLFELKLKIYDQIFPLKQYVDAPSTGDHDEDGIIIISGSDIKKNVLLNNVNICDVTPTILSLMSLPTGKDMDGKVITDAIEENFLEKNPIQYVESYDLVNKEKIPGSKTYHEKLPLDDATLERLKSLGYIQ